MENEKVLGTSKQTGSVSDHPGVYVPPPLIYVSIFLLSVLMQKIFPLSRKWFESPVAHITGFTMIGLALFVSILAIRKFAQSKNTLVTVKPASSLEISGIYSLSRNPMYAGLLILYTGIACLKGNWWTILFIPELIVVVQNYIIKREERYLKRRFGEAYEKYAQRVRRWL